MGHHVTVEGSVTPSDWLGRGVRRTVAVTDQLRKLVRIGAVVVVAGSLDDPAATAYAGTEEPDAPSSAGEPDETADSDAGSPPVDDRVPEEPPARNAGREDWAEWVAVKVPGAVTEGLGRDELRQIWDDFDGQR